MRRAQSNNRGAAAALASVCLCATLAGCVWPRQTDCNPLGGGAGEDCYLPFPSSRYLLPDPSTATRLKPHLPESLLPTFGRGRSAFFARLNRGDGFSPATTLLAYFPVPVFSPERAVDRRLLPGPERIAASLSPQSTAQLLRYPDGARVPLYAEVDQNADPQHGARQALILRPVVRLQPRTRYVALLQELRQLDGAKVPPLSGFDALRRGERPEGDPEQARVRNNLAFLQGQGLDTAALNLAWDFTTASDEPITDRLVHMRDEAARYDLEHPGAARFLIEEVTDWPAEHPALFRQITGWFRAASFLRDDDSGPLALGEDGEPVLRDYGRFPLVVQIPRCALAAPAPVPVMIYGHGSFSTALDEMQTPYQMEILERLCMVRVGTDWLGRAQGDYAAFLRGFISDLQGVIDNTDRLQQAHVNVMTLARLIRAGALGQLPELRQGGRPLLDSQRLYYYGISEGGIQGATLLALSPDIERGALNVACGFWSMFFWRSSDFHYIYPLYAAVHQDGLEQQLGLLLQQPLWDYTDPATYAPHLLDHRLAGSGDGPVRVLYQEGINDASVPNQTTRAMVRTLGLPLMTPLVEEVVGVPTAPGPQPSAYVQFDVGVRPRLGGDDVPPRPNAVHTEVRALESAKLQLQRFLREGGQVEDTCGGQPCLGP